MPQTRTCVTFHSSAFNTTEQGVSYINPDNYGDDLAHWVGERLREQHVTVEQEIGQEDFGWYVTFEAAGQSHTILIGHRSGEERNWVGWLERRAGFLTSLLGARPAAVMPEAARVIHSVLASSREIRNVHWHFREDFDAGDEDDWDIQPTDS